MIYLDNAASSWPKPPSVLEAIADWVSNNGANPGRAGHKMARSAGRMITDARTEMAHFFGVLDPDRIVFLQNVTEALNLALQGLLRPGDHVVGAGFEHNSVRRPLERMRSRGVLVDYVTYAPDNWITQVLAACTAKTRMVVATHGSNVTGEVLPVDELGMALRGIRNRSGHPLFLVDAAQTAGLIPICLHTGHIDLLAFTGHKALYGPQGTGGLYIAPDVSLEPLLLGGSGGNSLSSDAPAFGPERYEAGTRNTPGIAGLLAGLRFVVQQTPKTIWDHDVTLTAYLIEELRNIPAVTVNDTARASPRLPIVSFQLEGYQPAELAYLLDEHYDIAVRAGLHCSPHAHMQLRTADNNGTVRASIGYFNTERDIDILLAAVKELASNRE